MQLLGLRTTIYPAPDLAAAKTWFTKLLGKEPYFDQPFYVGYNVAGYELGLDPSADPALGAQAYWGVPDARIAVDELVAQGATIVSDVFHTGDGIKVAKLRDPLGNLICLIENPVFELPAAGESPGPGR